MTHFWDIKQLTGSPQHPIRSKYARHTLRSNPSTNIPVHVHTHTADSTHHPFSVGVYTIFAVASRSRAHIISICPPTRRIHVYANWPCVTFIPGTNTGALLPAIMDISVRRHSLTVLPPRFLCVCASTFIICSVLTRRRLCWKGATFRLCARASADLVKESHISRASNARVLKRTSAVSVRAGVMPTHTHSAPYHKQTSAQDSRAQRTRRLSGAGVSRSLLTSPSASNFAVMSRRAHTIKC